MLARLRSYGPSFDYEFIAEGWSTNPAARVAELNASGHHIEALRCFRWLPNGAQGWATLFVMRVKCDKTGVVMATPVPASSYGWERERWGT
jgi:hypothetical protein